MNQFKLAILLLLALSCAFGCSKGNSKLVVFHAGSLAGPMQDLAAEFEKLHPEVEVLREASGSMVAARKVSELGRKADVIALADSNVIERLLIPGSPGAMGSGKHANWYLNFARNRMVIAFTERSKYANEVDADNWYRILARKDVRFGRSDHNLDPCGYRTLMLWQLADMFYKDELEGKSIYEALDENCPGDNIRPGSVELLPLLESLDLDYAFEYLSVARQHRLRYVELPAEVDLGEPDLSHLYERAQVRITGGRRGEYRIVKGKPIVYGVTIPMNAPHPDLAAEFVELLLSESGQRIMERNGQPVMAPAVGVGIEYIPERLKRFPVR